jgi:hypothetical protein
MRKVFGRLVLGAAALSTVWLTAGRTPGRGVAAATADAFSNRAADRWMGVASCASSACHGGEGSPGAKRTEYATWVAHDKHARAYRVLFDERSRRIARNLPEPDGRVVEAHEKPLCLKCHASNNGMEGGANAGLFRADGVGCETCHGPAERWLTVHYQAGFKEKSAAEKERLGLLPTKDLTFRAKQCVACHVGNAEKEVNHDLIAAGHPRLSFEYAAYLALYPKHWSAAEERQRYPDFAARAWVVGQLVSAREALALLQARAEGAEAEGTRRKPWPEFSEYDCFACHKDLKVDSPRQQAGYGDRRPGALPYGNWYLTMPLMYSQQSGAEAVNLGKAVTGLQNLMQKPMPDSGRVAEEARKVGRMLDDWLGHVKDAPTFQADKVRGLMRGFLRDGESSADAMSWDQAAQLYLALAALQQDLGERTPTASLKKELLAVERRLKDAIPPGFNSPRRFDPLAEPRLRAQLKAIRDQLGQ